MKRFLLLAVSLMVTLALAAQKPRAELKLGSQMPQFTIESSVHGTIKSEDLKGKVVLINLFATWCPPCQKELAEVKSTLWPKYKDNKDFKMLVIGREHSDEELASYNQKKGFEFPLYPDKSRKVFSKFADQSIPRSYLYNKDGKLIWSGLGYTPEEFKTLMNAIENALK